MSTFKSVCDPKTLFDRWFERAISQLQKLENGDGGTAGMMVVLPLFERYINILTNNGTSGLKFYHIMASELQVADALQAETFWTTFRHGFCHTGMPLERGRKIAILPKVAFAAQFSSRPEFRTTPDGEEVICLDPWKFIHWVMEKYRNDPTLLTQHPDAPLLAIHAIRKSGLLTNQSPQPTPVERCGRILTLSPRRAALFVLPQPSHVPSN